MKWFVLLTCARWLANHFFYARFCLPVSLGDVVDVCNNECAVPAYAPHSLSRSQARTHTHTCCVSVPAWSSLGISTAMCALEDAVHRYRLPLFFPSLLQTHKHLHTYRHISPTFLAGEHLPAATVFGSAMIIVVLTFRSFLLDGLHLALLLLASALTDRVGSRRMWGWRGQPPPFVCCFRKQWHSYGVAICLSCHLGCFFFFFEVQEGSSVPATALRELRQMGRCFDTNQLYLLLDSTTHPPR